MKNFFLLFITICFYSLQVFALNNPQLRCVSVAASGDVTLNWLPPTDMSGFTGYEIYRSTSLSGTYLLVGSSSVSTDVSYTHVGAGANAQTYYYYVQAITVSNQYSSDILATIDFYLSNPGNGLAVLTWSAPISPVLPTYSTTYNILREYPAGIWTQISTANIPRYNDTITICDAMLGYRIELADASGCRNVSRINKDQFMDKIGPNIPVLDSVSVNFNTSIIEIGWEPSTDNDTYAYIIYHQVGGVWVPIDTCYGINNTFYRDTRNSPPAGIQSYRIAALDSCMNSSPMSIAQSTMRPELTYDTCRRRAILTWNPYENMITDVGKYRIYYTMDGGALQYAGETNGNTLTYTFPGLISGRYYCFIVKAISRNGKISATSIKYCSSFTVVDNDDYIYLRYVSVVANQYIEIKVYTGENSAFDKVNLYRSDDPSSGFTLIASLQNDGSDNYLFQDKDVKVDEMVYYYRATLENDCEAETVTSDVSNNILLTGEMIAGDRVNNLTWGQYAKWKNGVGKYIVVRKAERYPQFDMIEDTPALVTYYEDNVSDLATLGADFHYYIEAQESGINQHGFTDISRSNRIKLTQPPLIFIPNAFCPEGINNMVFKPVSSYVTSRNYSFAIYSRFGMLIFSTTDPNEGWDGTIQGELAELGVYIYIIRYINERGVLYEQTGTVTLIR